LTDLSEQVGLPAFGAGYAWCNSLPAIALAQGTYHSFKATWDNDHDLTHLCNINVVSQDPVPTSGIPKFTRQKLVCSKLEKKAGLMICANEDVTTKRGAFCGSLPSLSYPPRPSLRLVTRTGPYYIFQVVVDKEVSVCDLDAQQRIPHRITICPPFQLENLLPLPVQVRNSLVRCACA
jgi:hypothetical protein